MHDRGSDSASLATPERIAELGLLAFLGAPLFTQRRVDRCD